MKNIELSKWQEYSKHVEKKNKLMRARAREVNDDYLKEWEKLRERDLKEGEAWHKEYNERVKAYESLNWFSKGLTVKPRRKVWYTSYASCFPRMISPTLIKPTMEDFFDWQVSSKRKL